ncbi:hypothetical protein LshimejAT787_1701990 [Lyophyllum shimeji]|uniref:Uncharacterized protein n=1 Tax=Lyophyllum shimeji TaxID=47721 RepID=A0A9P3PX16_LYOSH|nr:hypothetical protein LshimejAT787_1701990 [Lyophyllum shimeji]
MVDRRRALHSYPSSCAIEAHCEFSISGICRIASTCVVHQRMPSETISYTKISPVSGVMGINAYASCAFSNFGCLCRARRFIPRP